MPCPVYQSQLSSTWVSTGTTLTNPIVWASNCVTASTTGTMFNCASNTTSSTAYNEIVIDEDQYLEHAEYFELARARGVAFRIRTAEEKRLNDERVARERAEYEERQRVRRAAEERARGLLMDHLTPEQQASLREHKWFLVIGGKTGHVYRIRDKPDLVANVDAIDDGCKLCAHARHDIPMGDQLLAQKLTIEFDEDHFLAKANRHAA